MKFFDVIDEKKWTYCNQTISEHHNQYVNAQPFPHIVIDDLFYPITLMEAEENFPKPDKNWWKYDNFMEKKWAKDDLAFEHESIRSIIQTLHEKLFVQFLEKLTGVEGLITDPYLNGGGLHQITRGGKLDVHLDYNFHPRTKLDRRLNVLLYLNLKWLHSWKGSLELWDSDMQKCVRAIEPTFNRMVVFSTTEKSNHGHPEPLECPPNVTRKSIAIYLYSNGRPDEEKAAPHSTIYKKRPQDEDDPEQDRMRQLRAIKRLQ